MNVTVIGQVAYNGAGQVTRQVSGNGVVFSAAYDLDARATAATDTAQSGSAAVPTLPQWAAILLGALLLAIGYRHRHNIPRSSRLFITLLILCMPAVMLLMATPATAAGVSLQYDLNGNVSQQTTPQGVNNYTYDALDRLTSEAGPAATQTFTYDPNGNRTQDGAGSYTYVPSSNRLATLRGASVSYDAAGNLTADGTGRTFTYNNAGRLSQVSLNGTLLSTYTYNYKGERTRKVTTAAAPQGISTTVYHYDENGHLIGETDQLGQPIKTYIWRDDTPVAQIDHVTSSNSTEKITYITVDELNTPRSASDANGRIVWTWYSDAFGKTLPNEDPDGDGKKVTINLRFPGQYFDIETGLHYNYMRDYDAQSGRYLQSDPIGLAGGINTYLYVGGNSLIRVDPVGEVGQIYWAYLATAATFKGLMSTATAFFDMYAAAQQQADAQNVYASAFNACNSTKRADVCGAATQAYANLYNCAGSSIVAGTNMSLKPMPGPSQTLAPNLTGPQKATGNSPRYPIFFSNDPNQLNNSLYRPGYNR